MIRAADGADLEAVRAFLAGLSPETRFRRFFTGLGDPGSVLLHRLLDRDDSHGSLVAVDDGLVVGHASWALLPEESATAELAVVVADAYQGRGLGTRLITRAAEDAESAGASRLQFAVLGENRRVAGWLARTWPDLRSIAADGVVVYEVDLTRAAEMAEPNRSSPTAPVLSSGHSGLTTAPGGHALGGDPLPSGPTGRRAVGASRH